MEKKKELAIGGQAVIEGVAMRGPKYIATAIRRQDKTIELKREEFISITQKNKILGLPVIRGFISLFEVLGIGFKTLTFSAERAELDVKDESKKEKSKKREQFENAMSIVVAIIFAFALFTYLPYQLAYLLKLQEGSLFFNFFAGVIRIIFFVAYVKIISLFKDVKRIFEYHGAEHKTVFAYEKEDKLSPAEVDKYSTIHPRCGTSFIFLVLLVSILIFSITDYIYAIHFDTPKLFIRIGYHLLLIPFISGFSYEILKFSGKHFNNPLVKIFTAPGMLLQNITTQKPDKEQLEVAIISLKYALEMDLGDETNIKRLENVSN